MRTPITKVAGVLGIGALLLSGCSGVDIAIPDSDDLSSPSTASSSQESTGESHGSEDSSGGSDGILRNGVAMNAEQARTALADLPVEEAHPMSGYSRDAFPHWLSADDWGWEQVPYDTGCDAREATLARDGADVVMGEEECEALSGTWVDPYTGITITDPSELDIDHTVPLAAAFRAGADEWPEEKRRAYANSPLVLVASDAGANREKGDKGPAAWKPERKASWCAYSIRWIAVKDEFGLNLTSGDEREALTQMLDTCKGA